MIEQLKKSTLEVESLKALGEKYSFSQFEEFTIEQKFPIIPTDLVRNILESLERYYQEVFDGTSDRVDRRILELKAEQLLERLELGASPLGGYSLIHGDYFQLPFDTICSLLYEKIELLLTEQNQGNPKNGFMDWSIDRQTDLNKPKYDQNNQVLLATLLKEQGVFLADIEVGDISKAWYYLTGYKPNHFTNMQGENQKDKLLRTENLAKIQRLLSKIQTRLDDLRKEQVD